jgi:hypothetical protein
MRGVNASFGDLVAGLDVLRARLQFRRVPGLFRVFAQHSQGGVESQEKSVLQGLTYFLGIVRLQMVRHFLKVSSRAGDSQSGLKYSKEQIL